MQILETVDMEICIILYDREIFQLLNQGGICKKQMLEKNHCFG